MNYSKPFFILIIVVLECILSHAQDVKFVALSKFSQNEGLSSYYVTKIIKDSYGFLWIGTQEGLNLFDGINFQVFSKQSESKRNIGGNFVSDLVEDTKRNLLWVLTSYGDICGIDLQTRNIKIRISFDTDKMPLTGKWVRSLALQGDTLWFGGLGVLSGFVIGKDRYLSINLLKKAGLNPAGFNIARLAVDKQDRLWIFNDGSGIIVIDKHLRIVQSSRPAFFSSGFQSKKLRFWDVLYENNLMYVGTSRGLHVFSAGDNYISCKKLPSGVFLDTAEVFSISLFSANKILFSAANRFCSFDFISHQLTEYRDEDRDDDWLSLTYQIFYDKVSQKIWAGTQSGLASFEGAETPFDAFTKSAVSSTRIKHAFSLLPVSNFEVYCGDENGVFYVRTDKKEIEKIDNGSSNLLLFRDWRGNIFLSNTSGFYLIKGKSLVPAESVFPSLKRMENDQFNSWVQFNDSIILFGSVIQKGLTVWNVRNGKLKTFHKDSSLYHINELSVINNLYKSNLGKVFILTEKSILEFSPLGGTSTVHYINIDQSNIAITNFMDMCETNDSYWIGTYGDGIVETDKEFRVKKIIKTTEGLCNNCVYKVFNYQNKSIVATTNNGLSTVDCRNYNLQNYFQSDGLHSSFFEQVCGCQYKNRIFAGGVNGFTIIDPDILFSNPVPPMLYFNKVTIQTPDYTSDTSNISPGVVTIPPDILQVTVSLSGLNYKNPRRIKYAYKIGEGNTRWIDLNSQNFINLPGAFAPGRYKLFFKCANEAGVWNEKPLSLLLIYLPKWYQTLWFDFAVGLAALGLMYGFYRYRIRQLKKQQQIRVDIASDLHDDIGSALNTVKVFTHLAKRDAGKTEHINQIEESIAQATTGLRDMIWILDDSQDTLQEILERIKKFALPVTIAHGIRLECHNQAEDNAQAVTKTKKRNLLLVAKECINNSIKYAGCKNIQVVLNQKNNKVSLVIKDDGKGFNLATTPHGNGIGNIHHRAKQINAVAEIISAEGEGTMISIIQR